MKLTDADVIKVAKLAKIKLDADQEKKMKESLESIFGWIEQLQNVTTDNVENYSDWIQSTMYEREDTVTSSNLSNEILKNAPEHAHGMFSVPKVVE